MRSCGRKARFLPSFIPFREELTMIVRNFNDPEVLQTTYRAHYGATARMVLTSQFLESMEFLAYAMLPAGNVLEEHIDSVEEIYLIVQGGGLMKVGDEEKEVKEWDAVWIPAGAPHRLENTDRKSVV